ncbi:MAG TPA: acyl-phosphate glycerol 3-phosphate acyltransferase [Ruminococcaceae bacterium]|nr:acyl-phosphate glycerol 3-phosphate acyltransferase [Oscillospiraceae bacterium]
MFIVCMILAAVVPYLLCGINSAIIVTKIKSGQDIRELGSGNAGLTNTLRTQGKAAALFVLIGDILKGVLSIVIVHFLFRFLLGIDTYSHADGWTWINYMAGIFGVIGHVFPVYYGFKGGKGVLVTFAAMLAINWIAGVVPFIIFAIVVAISRYVSLGSIIAAACYPFCVLIFSLMQNDSASWINFGLAAVIGVMLIYMHRENIKRLMTHTEKKLGQRSEENEAAK